VLSPQQFTQHFRILSHLFGTLLVDPPGERHTVTHEIRCNVETFWKTFFDKTFNENLGLERAEAVKRYLYEQHQIPLHKMNVISYGEEKPIAPNTNREGRAQNRRVVVKVLS